MTTIGKLKKIRFQHEFEWKIEDFTSLPIGVDAYYYSPNFFFADATWCLKIYPDGQQNEESDGFVDLYLCRKSEHPITLNVSFIIRSKYKHSDLVKRNVFNFTKDISVLGIIRSLCSTEFDEYVPKNVFTVICRLKYTVSDARNNEEIVNCSYCEKTSNAEDILVHEKKCLNKPIKCPECGDVIKLTDWYEHVCQVDREKIIGEMLQYFNDIMMTGEHSDMTIQVKNVEFRLHRNILAARNPYFSAMFKNDMKEKNTGIVRINDCEPAIFCQFVRFLYMGKVEGMSQENVCSLFEIADKYQDEHLKEACLNFMSNALSVENFFDFISLALKFGEKKLFKKTVHFFISRDKEITHHRKWLNFVKENPLQANELFIKSMDNYKSKTTH